MGLTSMGFNIFARDFASPTFSRIAGEAQASSAKTSAAWKKAGVGIAAVGVGIGAALLQTGKVFDKMHDTIVTGTGASGKALKGLEATAYKIGRTTPSSFEDIGTAVADLNTRLGLTGKPLQTVASKMLNMSRITGTDLSRNIANVTRVFGDWGVSVKNQPKALDEIFEATKRTGIGLDTLTQNVVQFGAPLRQFGFNMEQSLALFGKWEKEGVNTQVVLAGLKIGLGNFANAGKEPAKALAETQKAIMAAGSAGEANRIAIEAFGKRAGPDMAAAVREGRFELGNLVSQLKNSGGSIADADKRTRSWQESWQILKNKGLLLIRPAAQQVFEAFSKFVGWLSKEGIPVFKREMLPTLQQVGQVLGVVARFLWRNRDVIVTLAKVALPLLAAYKAWVAIQWALNVAMNANPIGLIITAVALLAAGLIYAYKHSETFRKIVQTAFGLAATAAKVLGKGLSFVWDIFKGVVGWIAGKALGVFRLWFNVNATVIQGIIRAWVFMGDKVLGVVSAMLKGIGWIGDKLHIGFLKGFSSAGAAVDRWRSNMRSNTDKVIDFIQRTKDAINGIPKNVRTDAEFRKDRAVGSVNAYARAIKSALHNIPDEQVNILAKINQARAFKISHLPGNASGGPIHGPGTETSDSIIMRLSRGEHVWSAREVRAAGGHQAMERMRAAARGGLLAQGRASGGPVDVGHERIIAGFRGQMSNFAGIRAALDSLAGKFGAALAKAVEAAVRRAQVAYGGALPHGATVNVVRAIASRYGWGSGAQWAALAQIINHESGFRSNAQNPSSTAYGLFQFLDSTWAGTGIGKTSNAGLQAVAGMRYIRSRYGSPINAWSFWQAHHWYDDGGFLPPGVHLAVNKTGQPEPVLTQHQWNKIDRLIQTLSDNLGRNSHFVEAARDLKRSITKQEKKATALLDRLAERQGKRSDFEAAVSSPFLQNENLFSVTDAGGGFSLDDFVATLKKQRADARAMRNNLKAARGAGLSGPLFRLLAESGNVTASAVFAAMSPGQINDLEGLFKSRTTAAENLAKYAGRTIYSPSTEKLNHSLNKLERTIHRMLVSFNRIQIRSAPALAAARAKKRAGGGRVWPGQAFLVGENEPELLEFDRSGYITPMSGAAMMGGGVVVMKVYLDGRQIQTSLKRLRRKGGGADLGIA